MIHLPNLIQDLGYILGTAAVVTLVFRFLKQPIVLGYLIAGFFVGPHMPFIATITEISSVKVWAEIGVIFLLFSLGLEFSFKKLTQVGKSAALTAAFEISCMIVLGYVTGLLLGWSRINSLFLGAILSISSTTIIVKAFEEYNLKGRRFVSHVFGVLVVEDLIAILLMVTLSSIAVSQAFEGSELIFSALRLGFFVILWFVLGIYILPIFLKQIKNYLSNETTLIVSISMCLAMVLLSAKVGFSPALGAFIMGSLLAETREGKRIEHLMVPVKDLFGAVFFVSVGMLIDPQIIQDHFIVIILLSLILILGKFSSVTAGSLLAGRNIKNSIQSGLSLTQIGEFSFIIATLGVSLKVIDDSLYPIAVAVSAITTFTTPYMIRFSDPIYEFIDSKLPLSIKDKLNRYEEAVATTTSENLVAILFYEYGLKIIINTVMVIALSIFSSELVLPRLIAVWSEPIIISAAVGIATLILATPFIWAIVISRPRHKVEYSHETLLKMARLQYGISFIRFVIGVSLSAFIIGQFASLVFIPAIALAALTLVAIYFSRLAEPLYKRVESRFIENLSEKEKDDLAKTPLRPQLAPWSASLSEFVVSPQSEVVAQTLLNSSLKEKFGVIITMIERGDKRILAPNRDELLLPFDKLFVIGTEDQLTKLKSVIEFQPTIESDAQIESFGLDSLLLKDASPYLHKSIRDCGLREAAEGLIVGIERDGERILNPDSSLTLKSNDLLWVVGNLSKLKALKSLSVS